MDLSQCPRCHTRWSGGDFCGSCGFVPIGAGLKGQAKKKKKKGRYVEPGSGRGSLIFILLVGIGGGAFYYKPWQEDWALVRYWMGQGHIHSVKGQWNIVKATALRPDAQTIFANKIGAGSLKFDDKNGVKFELGTTLDKVDVNAVYVVNGRSVFISKMSSESGTNPLPGSIHLDLTWQGPDTIVASVSKDELVYLQRRPEKSGLARMLQFRVKPDSNVAVPSQMQGIIKGLDKQMKENEE